MALVFDIETIGNDFESFDSTTKNSLTHWIQREVGGDELRHGLILKEVKEGLGFSPLTGEIAALGVYDTVADKGVVYFQSPDIELKDYQEENFTFKPRTEVEMISAFWEGIKNYDKFISFNGRSFDVPFINIRSAIRKIKPTKDLLFNRYLNSQPEKVKHIDLLDQFSFYGAMKRKGNLHLYCNAFGIKSPKANGISGNEVDRLFKEKKYQEIAEYNSWDLIATAELYKVWQEYIKI